MKSRYLSGLFGACLACLAGPAAALIVDCPPAQGAGRFSVFLSEPSGGALTAAQLKPFLQRLQFELDRNRDGQWINAPSTDVSFVACPGRAPALDGQDFNATLVDGLQSRGVLLEVWGLFDSEPGVGGAPRLSAQMNYLLVPLQFAVNQREAAPTALQRLRYPEAGTAAQSPVQDPVQLISRPLDIDAFVATAFGYKLLRGRSYEPAHANLCRANSLLETMARRPLAGRSKTELAGLRAFVLESAGRAVREALADPGYSKSGVLRLQNPARPCAGEE
ncbi:hypothetical protein BH11PSE10_BH11PSE10_01300 [soil metagenome]